MYVFRQQDKTGKQNTLQINTTHIDALDGRRK